jgi:arylsulfatase
MGSSQLISKGEPAPGRAAGTHAGGLVAVGMAGTSAGRLVAADLTGTRAGGLRGIGVAVTHAIGPAAADKRGARPTAAGALAAAVAAAALVAFSLAGCRGSGRGSDLPWVRLDLWVARPGIEAAPPDAPGGRPCIQRIAFLGAEEVRDMSRVPPQQLAAFPKRTAGQIRALETSTATRLRWHVKLGEAPYFSFIPLGFEKPCPSCLYRMGLRTAAGEIKELFRAPAKPVARFAPATVEVDLGELAGEEIDLLVELDGEDAHRPGQPPASALWGSPALYHRLRLAPRAPAPPRAAPRSGAQPPAAPPGGGSGAARPNVLFIGIDTLRADALGAWGRSPSLTPSLDRLAAESDVWLDAYTAFNVTNPSFVSMMTGLYGKNHGVYDLKTPLPAAYRTLATLFNQAGYATLAIISARHLGDQNSGLGQGFEEVTRADEHFAGELAVDMAMDWIAAETAGPPAQETANPPADRPAGPTAARPFFAWVHLFDPHTPHTPPEPYASGARPAQAAGLSPVRRWVPFRPPGPRDFAEPVLGGHRDLYDGQVAYVDRQVGRLLDFLASHGLLAGTLIVLVADHGENLGEHGINFRHVGLFDTTTHVPLAIRWPGEAPRGRRIHGLVQTIDLFPTLLAAAGLPVPPQDGADLRQLTGSAERPLPGRRAVFAEHAGKLGSMVRTARWKFVLSQGNTQFLPDGPTLYDLAADPGETRNLAGRSLPAERELAELLGRWSSDRRGRPAAAQPKGLTPEEIERLRSLGYAGDH